MPSAVNDSVESLTHDLQKYQLLAPGQIDEVNRHLRARFDDQRALADELLKRGWLTAFQAKYLLAGRGSSLAFGPYRLIDRLGEGGSGQVFKARHFQMRRTVALKVLRTELLSDPEVVQRFHREVQILSRLTNPYIVHAFDAGQIGAVHYLAMEYIEGADLDEIVKKRGPLGIGLACYYMHQAALGLQHAHEKGLVHRDIKPSNLIVTSVQQPSEAGQTVRSAAVVKILDLGLARVPRNRADTASVTLTLDGKSMMGTPDYLAPEQALDFHTADIRADLYSLGCTFFFLLTGQAPFPNCTLAQKLMKHQMADPPPFNQFRNDVPAEVEKIVLRLMAKNPDNRFQTPGDLAQSLQKIIGRLTPVAPLAPSGNDKTLIISRSGDTRVARLSRFRRMRRWFAAVSVCALCLFVFLFAKFGLPGRSPAASQAVLLDPKQPAPGAKSRDELIAEWKAKGVEVRIVPGNVALAANGATASGPGEPAELIDGVTTGFTGMKGYTQAPWPCEWIVTLPHTYMLQEIRFLLWDGNDRYYRYIVETSTDGKTYTQVADRSKGEWRSWQTLSFSSRPVKYIKLQGLYNSQNKMFHVVELEAYCIPPAPPGSTRPGSNPPDVSNPPTVQAPPGERDAATAAAFLPLAARYQRVANGATDDADALRQSLLAFQVEHPGTNSALRAGGMLRDLPSPLDRLSEKNIVAAQRRPWLPAETVAVLGEHRGRAWDMMTALAISPDNRIVAGGCTDGSVPLFERETLVDRMPLKSAGQVSAVAFADSQTVAAACRDYKVRIWSLAEPNKAPVELLHPSAYVNDLAFASGGKLLAAANADSKVHIWEKTAAAWKERPALTGHTDWVHRVAFTADGKTLASGGGDGAIRLWTVSNDTIVEREVIKGHMGAILALSFSPDGKLLLSGGYDRTVQLWDTSGKEARAVFTHKDEGRIVAAALNTDGKLVAFTGNYSGAIELWSLADLNTPRRLGLIRTPGPATALQFTPDGKTLVTTGADRRIRYWDVSVPVVQERVILPGMESGLGGAGGLTLSADGTHLAVNGRFDPTIQFWNLSNGAPFERMRASGVPGLVSPMSFSPDGKYFALSRVSNMFYFPHADPNPKAASLEPLHQARVVGLTFAPDGKTLASAGSNDQMVRLWDSTRADPKERTAIKMKVPIMSIAFTANGKTLGVLGADRKVHLLDMGIGAPVERDQTLDELSDQPVGIGFSPDGKYLAVLGSKDGRTTIWDWTQPRPVLHQTLGGMNGTTTTAIYSLAFSADGRTVAVTTSGAENVIVCDLASGKKLRSWQLPGSPPLVDFASDSRHLVVGNGNGTVYILRLEAPLTLSKK